MSAPCLTKSTESACKGSSRSKADCIPVFAHDMPTANAEPATINHAFHNLCGCGKSLQSSHFAIAFSHSRILHD